MTCTREDGSQTWTSLHPGMEDHDLAHFALESTLAWQEAFFGLVSKGHHVGDFELPRDKRPQALIPANLPSQAKVAECVVGILQVQRLNSGQAEDVIEILKPVLEERSLSFPPELSQENLERAREKYYELLSQWAGLSPGETMHLEFKLG